jgi:hypothetical protein
MTLMFGDYVSGNTPDSQSHATQVFGGPGQQHSVGTVHGGNENNAIAVNMSGGSRRHTKRRRHTRKHVKGGNTKKHGLTKHEMKTIAKKVVAKEMKKHGGGVLTNAQATVDDVANKAKNAVNSVFDGTKTAVYTTANKISDVANETAQKVSDVANNMAKRVSGGSKKTLKNKIAKELKKELNKKLHQK